jgi:hypothetical protein
MGTRPRSSRHRGLDRGEVAARARSGNDLGLARGKPVERCAHGRDLLGRHHDGAVAVGRINWSVLLAEA